MGEIEYKMLLYADDVTTPVREELIYKYNLNWYSSRIEYLGISQKHITAV